MVSRIRDEKKDEIDGKLSGIIEQAFDVVKDRLANGETVFVGKDAQERKKPVTARDATWIGAVSFDKRQIMRNQPTAITSNSTTETLRKLAEEFTTISNEIKAKTVAEQKGDKK